MRMIFLLCSLMALFTSVSAASQAIPAKVVSISDGDSFRAELYSHECGNFDVVYQAVPFETRVRMASIDAPELAQECGYESKLNLETIMPVGSCVLLIPDAIKAKDKYGRLLADIHYQGNSMNLAQLRQGYAWYYDHDRRKLSRTHKRSQVKAQKEKLGIWYSPAPVAPWVHRQRQ